MVRIFIEVPHFAYNPSTSYIDFRCKHSHTLALGRHSAATKAPPAPTQLKIEERNVQSRLTRIKVRGLAVCVIALQATLCASLCFSYLLWCHKCSYRISVIRSKFTTVSSRYIVPHMRLDKVLRQS